MIIFEKSVSYLKYEIKAVSTSPTIHQQNLKVIKKKVSKNSASISMFLWFGWGLDMRAGNVVLTVAMWEAAGPLQVGLVTCGHTTEGVSLRDQCWSHIMSSYVFELSKKYADQSSPLSGLLSQQVTFFSHMPAQQCWCHVISLNIPPKSQTSIAIRSWTCSL